MQTALLDMYSSSELNDDTEVIYHYVPEDFEDCQFDVFTIEPDSIPRLIAPGDGRSLLVDVFAEFATEEQREIVAEKKSAFDADRIVVMSGSIVLDGNHHVMAAHQLGESFQAIDLENPVYASKPNGPK